MADYAKARRNVQKMLQGGASEQEIDAYLAHEGVTPHQLKAYGEASRNARGTNGLERAFGQGVAANFGDEMQAGLNAGITGLNNLGAKVGLTKGAGFSMKDAYDATMQAENDAQQAYQKEHPAASIAANIVGGIASPLSRVGGTFAAGGKTLAGTALRTGLVGAGTGALYGSGEGRNVQERSQNALWGGLVGGALGAASPYAGKATKMLGGGKPAPLSKYAQSVKRLQDEGVDVTYGQMLGGIFKDAEDKASLFLGGIRKAQRRGEDQWYRNTINKPLKMIGDKLDDATDSGQDAAKEMIKKVGKYYDDATKSAHFTPDAEFHNNVKELASDLVGADNATVKQAYKLLNEAINNPVKRVGTLTGKDLSRALSQIRGAARKNDNPYIKEYATGLVNEIIDAAGRTNPKSAEALRMASKAYAHMIPVERAATKAGLADEGFTTTQFANGVKASAGGARGRTLATGEANMQQTATDATKVLKMGAKSSGTTENAASLGLVTTFVTAALMHSPVVAIPAAAAVGAKIVARGLYSKPVLGLVNNFARSTSQKGATKALRQLEIAAQNNPEAQSALKQIMSGAAKAIKATGQNALRQTGRASKAAVVSQQATNALSRQAREQRQEQYP